MRRAPLGIALVAGTLLAGAHAGETPLRVFHLSGAAVDRTEPPQAVTWGVPLPRGAAASAQDLQLLDATGKPVPCQFDVTATWDDGKSPQWVLLSFTVDPATAGYRLRYGVTPAVAVTPPTALKVERQGDGYEVDTGAARFAITPTQPVSGLYLVATGEKYQGRYEAAPAELKVTRLGPQSVTIRAQGWYRNAAGQDLCQYVLRFTASAGSPVLRLAHTFIMTASSGDVAFADLGLRLPVSGARHAVLGLDKEPAVAELAPGQSAHLLQDNWNHSSVRQGDRTTAGGSAPGWAVLAGPTTALVLGVRDFWQNFPLELEAEPDALTLHFWPAHGRDTDLHAVDLANINKLWFVHEGKQLDFRVPAEVYSFRGAGTENDYRYVASAQKANAMGLAKTHEFALAYCPSGDALGTAAALHRLLNDPLVVCAEPDAMCASGTFYDLWPRDEQRFPEIEQTLSAYFDWERRMEDKCADYGKWNFGDSHTSWRWDQQAFDTIYRTWRNTHHGAPRVPWLLFARSADPKYLRYGVRNARHVLDLDYCHYTTPELEKLDYPEGKIVGALNDYKGLVHWHSGSRLFDYNSMTDFALHYTAITGDAWGREVALSWGESVLRRYRAPTGHREGAGVLSALVDLYRFTWDRRYLPLIHAYADTLVKSQKPDGSTPQWENYAPWLEDYLWLTAPSGPCPDAEKHAAAQAMLVRWADAFLRGHGDYSSEFWGCENILAAAYGATGDVRYLADGMGKLIALQASAFGDPQSPWFGWWAISGGGSLAGYHLQRIPYLMSALARHQGAIVPAYPESRFWQVPVWHLRNPEGQDMALRLRGNSSEPGTLTLQAPDGAVLKTWDVPKGDFDLRETVTAAGAKGNYRLVVAKPLVTSLWTPLSDLGKEVAEAQPEGINAMRGSRLYFLVPQGCGQFTLQVTGRIWPQTFVVLAPDGRQVERRDWDEFQGAKPQTVELRPAPAEQGKLWCIQQGMTKNMIFRLSVPAGQPAVPAVFASADPDRFFLP